MIVPVKIKRLRIPARLKLHRGEASRPYLALRISQQFGANPRRCMLGMDIEPFDLIAVDFNPTHRLPSKFRDANQVIFNRPLHAIG